MVIENSNTRPDFPIHPLLSNRWSPDAFKEQPVPEADLCSLFEAARWAPSSYNEQPWSFIIARKENPEEFQNLLSCLVEENQSWAKSAPVLVLNVVRLKFVRNGKDNKAAIHDLGLAAANLVVEATSRGLTVHQMIGIIPEKGREIYGIPEGWEPFTAMAIGYNDDSENIPERKRKRLNEFVFSGKWGKSFIAF